MRPVSLLIVLGASLVVPSGTEAQTTAQLEAGQRVRLQAPSITSNQITGRVISYSGDSLTILCQRPREMRGSSLSLPLSDVVRLRVFGNPPLQSQAWMSAGKRVRLSTADLSRATGLVSQGDRRDVALASGQRVPTAAIDSLWDRSQSTGKGAMIGGVVGGALTGVAFVVLSGLCETDCPSKGSVFAIGVVAGGVGGGLLGTVIGAGIPRWRLRYPKEEWLDVQVGPMGTMHTPRVGMGLSIALRRP
jgi:hypothetical protein